MKQTGPASNSQANQPSILHLPCRYHDQPATTPDTCKQSLRSLPAEQVASRSFRSPPNSKSQNYANAYVFKCDSYRPCSLCLRASTDCVTTGRSTAVSAVIAGDEERSSISRSSPQQHGETPNRRKRRRSGPRDDQSGTRTSASLHTTRNAGRDSDSQSFATEEVRAIPLYQRSKIEPYTICLAISSSRSNRSRQWEPAGSEQCRDRTAQNR
jgi:hypothetical protein